MFKKVLVANRGEIAVRIIRALREMEIPSVAIYSDADRNSLHRLYADYSYHLNGCKASDTYMNMEKILKIALQEDVDAVHPGYGFLAENEEFPRILEQIGITFIGPDSKIIELMGNKIAARKMMEEVGIPMVPGSAGAVECLDDALSLADLIGYPLLIKAAAGGGGIGMKIVHTTDELSEMFERVQEQAASVFGDKSVFIEKYLENARHIEFQILADKYGNIVHLGERECSIQRRHQKIIEESPSPALDEDTRQKMGAVAVSIAKAAGYHSAGTVEFIFSNGKFYFLEMNTRLQVEHPVTEMLTGIDIVKSQIRLAAGMPLPFRQDEIVFRGHAIESRICAEDPLNGFIPSPGKITGYRSPGGIGVRVDSGVHYDYEISSYYDSMISKLVVWGENREEAINRMRRTLREYIILGPKTNIPYLGAVIESLVFQSGEYNTRFVEEEKNVFEIAKRIHEQQFSKKDL
jgi:pyruvate carboxylase subunit A